MTGSIHAAARELVALAGGPANVSEENAADFAGVAGVDPSELWSTVCDLITETPAFVVDGRREPRATPPAN